MDTDPMVEMVIFFTALGIGVGTLLYLASLMGIELYRGQKVLADEEERAKQARQDFPPHALDVESLLPRLQHVREDYVSAAHGRLHHLPHKPSLLAQARAFIRRLGYFRHHEPVNSKSDHTSYQ